MFIKELRIKNFKCFGRETSIDFHIPDRKNKGSGLNVFVGENNTGKSTIFESIHYFRNGTDSQKNEDIKNKNAREDDCFADLTFIGEVKKTIDNFAQGNKSEPFRKGVYEYKDTNKECFRLARSSKDPKLLKIWNNEAQEFENKSGIDGPLKKLFDTNFVWSDIDPNKEAGYGSTTICGSLLKEIMKSFEETEEYKEFNQQFDNTFNDEKSKLKQDFKDIEERTQEILYSQFGNTKISFHLEQLGIDSYFKKTEIKVGPDDIPMREEGGGIQRAIALALLQVYAKKLETNPEDNNAVKPSFLFIDEPEICLHPRAQEKLFCALLELSRTKQIFVATHSPYFIKTSPSKKVGFFIFEKEEGGMITIQNISKAGSAKLFPWSPSWGEINYSAYNLPTTDFHNELYGYIQREKKKNIIANMDNYLKDNPYKNIEKNKKWEREDRNEEESVTLPTYIRHSIHHPENKENKPYTPEELKDSLEKLIEVVKGIGREPPELPKEDSPKSVPSHQKGANYPPEFSKEDSPKSIPSHQKGANEPPELPKEDSPKSVPSHQKGANEPPELPNDKKEKPMKEESKMEDLFSGVAR